MFSLEFSQSRFPEWERVDAENDHILRTEKSRALPELLHAAVVEEYYAAANDSVSIR